MTVVKAMRSPLSVCAASVRAIVLASVLASVFTSATALDILVVSPFPSKSHVILGDGLVNILLEAGHKVTYITTDPQNSTHPSLRQIDASRNVEFFPRHILDMKAVIKKEMNTADPQHFIGAMLQIARATLQHEQVAALADAAAFDLVIAEWMFTEVYAGLAAVFDCPLIWFSTMEPHWMVLQLVNEATNPSYTPALLSRNLPPFTFKQRLEELFLQTALYFVKEWSMYYKEKDIYDNYYGPILAKRGRQLPEYNLMRFNASLVLGNSHPALGLAGALPHSYRPIAGFHVQPTPPPLPTELREIMDAASEGVVYFSMGTIVRPEDLPPEIKRKLVAALGRLRQTVVWKFAERPADLPANVHVVPWAPQQSVLAHPNCVLFVTHGGLLSLTEAVHYAVPAIGIPVFGDQHVNIQTAIQKGFGLGVDMSINIAEDLEKAIQEMLTNPGYRERVRELSRMYHERVAPARAEVAHWAAHVVATRGAPHLRSPALALPAYQKLYLDVAAVLALLLVATAFVLRFALSLLRAKITAFTKKNN